MVFHYHNRTDDPFRFPGITSIIRDLILNPSLYQCMEHFFRADSSDWDDIFTKWTKTVSRYAPLKQISRRTVLIGDGVKCDSDGRYMPCIKMVQESESVSKRICPYMVQMLRDSFRAAQHFGDSLFVLDRYFRTVPLLKE